MYGPVREGEGVAALRPFLRLAIYYTSRDGKEAAGYRRTVLYGLTDCEYGLEKHQ